METFYMVVQQQKGMNANPGDAGFDGVVPAGLYHRRAVAEEHTSAFRTEVVEIKITQDAAVALLRLAGLEALAADL